MTCAQSVSVNTLTTSKSSVFHVTLNTCSTATASCGYAALHTSAPRVLCCCASVLCIYCPFGAPLSCCCHTTPHHTTPHCVSMTTALPPRVSPSHHPSGYDEMPPAPCASMICTRPLERSAAALRGRLALLAAAAAWDATAAMPAAAAAQTAAVAAAAAAAQARPRLRLCLHRSKLVLLLLQQL